MYKRQVTELAEELGMTPEEIAMASDAATEVESIYRPIHQGEGTELQLLDKLPEKENRQERILDKIFLEELLNILGTCLLYTSRCKRNAGKMPEMWMHTFPPG